MNLLREYISELLSEAAYDVRDLGSKVIVISDMGAKFSVGLYPEKHEDPSDYSSENIGVLDARQFSGCNGAYEVRWSEAPKGWGPLLYDVAMEWATMKGGGLISDRTAVSPQAAYIWDYYYNNRDDVDYDQMDDYEGRLTPDDETDDCNQEIVYHGVSDSMRKSWKKERDGEESWEEVGKPLLMRSPLSKSYRYAGYSVIDDLRNAGKLVML